MCVPVAIGAALIAAAASAGSAVYSSYEGRKQQGDAAQAATDAKNAAGTAQKATAADTSGVNGQGAPASAGVNSGPASTLLTGAGGVGNSSLNLGALSGLGSNTLLGS